MADVDESVEADGADTEQGAEATGEADAGHGLAQCTTAQKPLLAKDNTCSTNT